MKKSGSLTSMSVRFLNAGTGHADVHSSSTVGDCDEDDESLADGGQEGGDTARATCESACITPRARTAADLKGVLHELSPVKGLVSRLGRARASVADESGGDEAGVGASSECDRWGRINLIRGKITRTVEDKWNDLRAERAARANVGTVPMCSVGADVTVASSSVSSPGSSSAAPELSACETPDVEFRSVAAPLHSCGDAACSCTAGASTPSSSHQCAGTSPRREFSLSRIKPRIYARLQRSRVSPLMSSSQLSHSVTPTDTTTSSAGDVMSSRSVTLSDLQNKYNDGGCASDHAEQGQEALLVLEPASASVSAASVSLPGAVQPRVKSIRAWLATVTARLHVRPPDLVTLWQKLDCRHLLVAVVAVLVAPLSSFTAGLLLGISVTLAFSWSLFCRLGLARRRRQPVPTSWAAVTRDPSAAKFWQLSATSTGPAEFVESPVYKGWMHELSDEDYVPDQSSSHNTDPVYIRLEASMLRISHYKGRLPRRASWCETLPSVPFEQQRIIDISRAQVFLLPVQLHHTKRWSRRYPICITVEQVQCAGSESAESVLSRDSTLTPSLSCAASVVSTSPASSPPSPQEHQHTDSNKISPTTTTTTLPAQRTTKLFLFARTDRDKEHWFRLLSAACGCASARGGLVNSRCGSPLSATTPSSCETEADQVSCSVGALPISSSSPHVDFDYFMSTLLPAFTADAASNDQSSLADSRHVIWFNALIGRLAYGLLLKSGSSELVQKMIQRKLSRIKLPYFIGELCVTSCHLGGCVPRLQSVSCVSSDERGLWVHVAVSYDGGASMTLATKLNLISLTEASTEPHCTGEGAVQDPTDDVAGQQANSEPVSDSFAHYNEPGDDSPEISSDEEEAALSCSQVDREKGAAAVASTQVGRRLMRVVDKVTSSRYFKQAAQNRYVKKYMEDVSNTRLELSVNLLHLSGTLCINVARPPTDRLWYGFRSEPTVHISAQPRLGSRDVTMSHVIEWIENSLIDEMKRLLVMPNMEDLILPYMAEISK